MALMRILQYPDRRLKQIAKPVDRFDDDIKRMIDDMFDTHYHADHCAALAAAQLDFKVPRRITVIDFSERKNDPLCLVNPEIYYREGVTNEDEGCMSVPGQTREKVKRSAVIRVRALNREGKPIDFQADGFMAKCIQHELDHLDGILFIDHVSRLKRSRIDKRLNKLRRTERSHISS